MDRREFLSTLAGGACAAVLATWQSRIALAAQAKAALAGPTVGIKRFGREQDAAKAVKAALEMIGGIDKVVKSGDVVIIKPNLCHAAGGRWVGRITSSNAMEGVIKAVVDCGARPIVAEGTCEEAFGTTTGFAKKIGLLDVCRRYGAPFVDLNNDEVTAANVPQPILWSKLHLARQALECDKFISVPVMKTHRAAGVTLGMKNLVGIMSPKYYGRDGFVRNKMHSTERRLWHQRYGGDMSAEPEVLRWIPLGATIADIASTRPIDLVVVDGTYGEDRNSPAGDLVDIKQRSGSYLILVGTDTVAVDSIGAHVMRQDRSHLQQLRFAAAKGLGTRKIQRINVAGERLEDVVVPMRGYIY